MVAGSNIEIVNPNVGNNRVNSGKELTARRLIKSRIVPSDKTSIIKAPLIKMNNGLGIPAFGLGTCMKKAGEGEVAQAIKDAIDAGYRHIDSAFNYLNETEVGEGIRAKIDDGTVTRQELFVISKLWNSFHRPDLVEVCCRKSLNDMGLDYLDLYLVHFPTAFKEGGERYPRDENNKVIYSKVTLEEMWKGMEGLVHKGLVKSIGVSNFNSQQLDRIIACATIKPVMNQVELHPYLNNRKLVEFCKSRDVLVTAYSPLRNPEKNVDNEPPVLEDPRLIEMANRYNKTVPQIILRWVYQRGVVVICKSANKERINKNFKIFDFHLNEHDMEIIYSLNRNKRWNIYFEQAGDHPEYPFAIEF